MFLNPRARCLSLCAGASLEKQRYGTRAGMLFFFAASKRGDISTRNDVEHEHSAKRCCNALPSDVTPLSENSLSVIHF